MITVEGLRWRIAYLIADSRLIARIRRQCWADLVGWVLHPDREPGWRAVLPWRPITGGCRDDARSAGRCYCGTVAADGSVLGRGEKVPTPDPAALRCHTCPHALPVHPPDGPCSGCRCPGWTPHVYDTEKENQP